MTPAPPRLPKWVIPHIHKCSDNYVCRSYEALSIAWAALGYYAKYGWDVKAKKAQRAIRRLSK